MTEAEIGDWAARCEARLGEVMVGDAAHDLAHVRRVVARLAFLERRDLAFLRLHLCEGFDIDPVHIGNRAR